jgi:CheY-like chemotaxis protein
MPTAEYASVFVRVGPERLAEIERLVLALPRLLEGTLARCDLAFRPSTGFLAVGVHLDSAVHAPGSRDRLAFWTARAGGRTTPVAALSPGDLAQLRAHLATCELARAGVAPLALPDVAAAFFTEAGAPAGRPLDAQGPVLALDVGGDPGGAHWDPVRQVLFVHAPVAPAFGDELPLRLDLPGVPEPIETTGTVVAVVAASAAPPGRAGFALRLDAPPPSLAAVLEGAAVPGPGTRPGAAPRAPARAGETIAPPPRPSPPEEAPEPAPATRRALVVDDDALLRRMLADALGARGFEVLTAPDALEGIRTLSDELLALDVLLTDVRMPGMDGEALVRMIRTAGGEADLAIVVVTGRLEPGMEPRLVAAGADAVLDKALGPERVAEAADAVVQRKRAARTDA